MIMAGHSKWKQIKDKKGVTDKKRSQVFSKILAAVSWSAKTDPNPSTNLRLKGLISKAKELKVPQDNIERAIKNTQGKILEEMLFEAYGPGGSAFIIKAITDSKNRTTNEIRAILKEFDSAIAESGSVQWAFNNDTPKFPLKLEDDDLEKALNMISDLDDQEDVQKVTTNIEKIDEIMNEE